MHIYLRYFKYEKRFFSYLESNINAVDNNPGRHCQSLAQASYNTWEDGPFGTPGEDPGRSISIYQKGSLAGLCLDLAIRHHSQNEGSLDDVMRYLYYKYYLEYGRGFTGAEFQQACEKIAGASLNPVLNMSTPQRNWTTTSTWTMPASYLNLDLNPGRAADSRPWSALAGQLEHAQEEALLNGRSPL